MSGLKALYTIAEVAALLGVSRHVVRHWVEAGYLEVERIGRKRYVPLAAIRARARVWDSAVLIEAMRGNTTHTEPKRRKRGGFNRK